MMRVELRSERTRFVEHDIVVESHPPAFRTELPGGFVDLLYGKLLARLTRRLDGNHVFCKISNLVKRIPYWKLNFVPSILRIIGHAYVDAMMVRVGQPYRV